MDKEKKIAALNKRISKNLTIDTPLARSVGIVLVEQLEILVDELNRENQSKSWETSTLT